MYRNSLKNQSTKSGRNIGEKASQLLCLLRIKCGDNFATSYLRKSQSVKSVRQNGRMAWDVWPSCTHSRVSTQQKYLFLFLFLILLGSN